MQSVQNCLPNVQPRGLQVIGDEPVLRRISFSNCDALLAVCSHGSPYSIQLKDIEETINVPAYEHCENYTDYRKAMAKHVLHVSLEQYVLTTLQQAGKPIDAVTRTQYATQMAERLLTLVQSRHIASVQVLCDASNNSPNAVAHNDIVVDVFFAMRRGQDLHHFSIARSMASFL